MTEKRQVNHTARRYLAPYGRWTRIENRVGDGTPDQHYTLRAVSGWVESKLIPASGACPAEFTRDQLMWGEAETAAGGKWFLLGLRLSAPAEWWLLDAPTARAWFEGRPFEPLVRVSGRFPLREILDRLAPLPVAGEALGWDRATDAVRGWAKTELEGGTTYRDVRAAQYLERIRPYGPRGIVTAPPKPI